VNNNSKIIVLLKQVFLQNIRLDQNLPGKHQARFRDLNEIYLWDSKKSKKTGILNNISPYNGAAPLDLFPFKKMMHQDE
jgi:hypothetical protein